MAQCVTSPVPIFVLTVSVTETALARIVDFNFTDQGALKYAQKAASAIKSLPVIKMELVKMAVYLISGDRTASNVMSIVWKIGHLKKLPNAMKPMGNVYMAVKVVTMDYNVLKDVTVIAERIRPLTFRFVTNRMEHAPLTASMITILGHSATDAVVTYV